MRKKKNTSKFKIIFLAIIAVLVLLFFWWFHGASPANSQDRSTHVFVVKPNEPLREIANQLSQQHLIADPTVFFLIVKQSGLDQKIQAGDFRISASMSPQKIAQSLTQGALDVWVTIPEGKRATEIASLLKAKFPQYIPDWEQKLVAEEGFLFPDTYLFSRDTSIDAIITTMKNNFTTKFDSVPTNPDNLYTQKQIVTVASLVEREAKFAEDRPLVASVIYNRLKIGMALQIDATIQYALGTSSNWWPVLTDSGKNILPDSLYNTYTNTGLPPTPISNPGLAALSAAIKPAQTNYLYYISDKYGHNHYTTTLEEHNANIQKYGL